MNFHQSNCSVSRCIMLLGVFACSTDSSLVSADESGVSVWLPGQFGSLAAAPAAPGWSLPMVYYHTTASADAGKDFEIGGKIQAGLDVHADLMLIVPTYTFATPLWGAQAQVSMTAITGKLDVSADATLTGPGGAALSGHTSDSLTSVGDLYSAGSLRWNAGVHNWMVYTQVGAPVGSYEEDRLANIGNNHWSTDAGAGYTYLDPETGREFSVVAGTTYNFENHDTDYQNGVDGHIDWGASQFLSEQVHVGLVGYFYNQLTGDSGSGARLGDFESRVSAIGPQVGYLFPMNRGQAYVNLKGYNEFDAKNRPEGWNVWLTLAIPLGSGDVN